MKRLVKTFNVVVAIAVVFALVQLEATKMLPYIIACIGATYFMLAAICADLKQDEER